MPYCKFVISYQIAGKGSTRISTVATSFLFLFPQNVHPALISSGWSRSLLQDIDNSTAPSSFPRVTYPRPSQWLIASSPWITFISCDKNSTNSSSDIGGYWCLWTCSRERSSSGGVSKRPLQPNNLNKLSSCFTIRDNGIQTDKEIQNSVSEHKNTAHAPNFFALRNLYISH